MEILDENFLEEQLGALHENVLKITPEMWEDETWKNTLREALRKDILPYMDKLLECVKILGKEGTNGYKYYPDAWEDYKVSILPRRDCLFSLFIDYGPKEFKPHYIFGLGEYYVHVVEVGYALLLDVHKDKSSLMDRIGSSEEIPPPGIYGTPEKVRGELKELHETLLKLYPHEDEDSEEEWAEDEITLREIERISWEILLKLFYLIHYEDPPVIFSGRNDRDDDPFTLCIIGEYYLTLTTRNHEDVYRVEKIEYF